MPADASLVAALADVASSLPLALPVACPGASADLLGDAGLRVVTGDLADVEPGSVAAVALVDDELGHAGEHAEELVARVGDVVHPGGTVLVTVPYGEPVREPRRRPALRETPPTPPGTRTFTETSLEALLAHRGLALRRLERHGGRLLAVARAPLGEAERSARFIASLPFKLVTSAVLCTDAEGRVLCVFDTFKRHWTIPGGVVDAREDPRAAAVREAYEEGGLRVRAGALLGVFCTAWPRPAAHRPTPRSRSTRPTPPSATPAPRTRTRSARSRGCRGRRRSRG